MKILITGAAGFIGSHLVESLLHDGHLLTGIDNFDPFYARKIKEENLKTAITSNNFQFLELDMKNQKKLIHLLSETQYHIIIHLAAIPGVRPSFKQPLLYAENNIITTLSLLDAMEKTGHHKLIFASSSSIYGQSPKIPFKETHNFDNALSIYAVSKQSSELFTRLFHKIYHFSIVNLRFFSVYGPRQRPDLAIHRFLKANILGEKITLFGDGSMARDYTHIEDIIPAIKKITEIIATNTSPLYQTYNLGNGTPITLQQLIATINMISNQKCLVTYQDIPKGDVPITHADISLAKKELGYSPQISIHEGLATMYPWIKSLYCI